MRKKKKRSADVEEQEDVENDVTPNTIKVHRIYIEPFGGNGNNLPAHLLWSVNDNVSNLNTIV